MQLHFRLPIFLFFTSVIIFSSCSKTNKAGRFIPKSASMAILINSESITSKLPWEEIKQNELYKSLYNDTSLDNYMKSALENPENTGIDMKKDILFFIQKDSMGGYIAVEGTIKDAAKFKHFNSNVTKGSPETEKDNIHSIGNDKITSSWDKDRFVIIIDAPQMKDANQLRKRFDSTYATPDVIVSKRSGIATAAEIFGLKENISLGKDEKFTDLVNSKGDVHFWINISSLSSEAPGMPALSLLNINRFYANSFMTGVVNFENGKINVDTRSYSGKELSDLNKKYSGSTINMDMIKRIPEKNLAALFAFSFKPEGLRELLKITGLDGFANIGAEKMGFSLDDFINANKGNLLLSLSDFKKDSTGSTHINGLFSVAVGDKKAMGKLIQAGDKIAKDKLGAEKMGMSYNMSNDYFALGTDKLTVDNYLKSQGNSNFPFIDKISGSSSVFYLNFQAMLSGMDTQLPKDSLDNISYQATVKMWDNMIITGSGFKDGAMSQHAEINLMDKATNSLKQLNNYLGILGNVQQHKKATAAKWMDDTNYQQMADSAMMQMDTR